MKKLLLLLALLAPTSALAQAPTQSACRYIATGAVLTAEQWNYCFQIKQDNLGFTPLNIAGGTMTGPLITAASSALAAGFNVPPGAAPTSPNNGDFWSTNVGFYGRVNGATVGPFTAGTSGSFTASSPILVTFPGGGVVNYAFDLTVANTFLAQQTGQGATTTSPGWYSQIAGDTFPRVRVGMNATDVPSIAFGPGNAVRDAFIERVGAGSLRFGAPDAASPVQQISSVQNVVAGTSNTAGANRTFAGSQGTGTGAGGSLIFQSAPAGSTGTSQNPLVTALTIFGTGGLSTGAATDQGAGTLNIAGSLYNNGTAPTGTGAYVRATSPTIASLTVTGAFTATGLVTNADLANSTITLGSTAMSLGSTYTTIAGAITWSGSPTFSSAMTYGGVTLSNAVTGTGNMVLSASPTLSGTVGGNLTLSGNITNGAQLIATGTSAPSSAAGNTVVMGTIAAPSLSNNGQAFLYNTTVNGAVLQGQGSTYDSVVANKSGSAAMGVSTGTVDAVFGGKITAASLSTPGSIGGSLCATSAGVFLYASGVNCFTAGAATSVAPGTTTISPTTTNNILYDNAGTLGEKTIANFLSAGNGIAITGTTTATISTSFATKSDQTTATSTVLAVNPGVQQYHPSAIKAAGQFASGTCSKSGDYNITSVSHTGTGVCAITFTTAFTSTAYQCEATLFGGVGLLAITHTSSSVVTVSQFNIAAAATDIAFDMICAGAQ